MRERSQALRYTHGMARIDSKQYICTCNFNCDYLFVFSDKPIEIMRDNDSSEMWTARHHGNTNRV